MLRGIGGDRGLGMFIRGRRGEGCGDAIEKPSRQQWKCKKAYHKQNNRLSTSG